MSIFLPVNLLGTGMCVPDEVLTNKYFTGYLDTSEEWIVTRTGINERRRVAPAESTSTLAAEAARRALADARLSKNEIDLIIVCTATSDTIVPACSCWVQDHLGLPGIPVFDLGAACAGFVYGVVVAASMINAGTAHNVLLIGAETLTRITDYQDRSTCILFGDAAGAAVITASGDGQRGIIHHALGAVGSRARDIWVPAGGTKLPASATTVAERLHALRMNGREVYKFAVVKMQELIDEALEATGLTPADLKMVIPHQSNRRIIESVRERMDLPADKVAVNIDRYGNTSAASIIVALDEARKGGQLKAGDHVLLIAIGAGLTWGVAVWRL